MILHDADILLSPDELKTISEDVAYGPLGRQFGLSKAATEATYMIAPDKLDLKTSFSEQTSKGAARRFGIYAGAQMLHKSLYLKAGKMDETFIGWAGETGEFLDRVKKSGGRIVMGQSNSIHLYHPHACSGKRE